MRFTVFCAVLLHSIPVVSNIFIWTSGFVICKKTRLVNLHWGDMTDSSSLIRIIQAVQPDEIYNLAAQSHVKVSFDVPEYTAEADAVGTLRMLEAVRILGLEKEDQDLSGIDFRIVRTGTGSASEGNDSLLSPFSVWGGQAVWFLDYQELS